MKFLKMVVCELNIHGPKTRIYSTGEYTKAYCRWCGAFIKLENKVELHD